MWYGMAEWISNQSSITLLKCLYTASYRIKSPARYGLACWLEANGYQPPGNWLASLA
jgi:hypothetical protein